MAALPHESVGGQMNCYDAIHDVDAALRDSILPEHQYYVLGGIASGALVSEGTVIDAPSETVIASPDSATSIVRPNGTRRDIDILVSTVLSEEDAERIKENVSYAVGHRLVVSVFGLDKRVDSFKQGQRIGLATKDWISHRTIDDEGMIRYELYPLARAVDLASFRHWRLVLPSGKHLDVLHPAGHTLAYSMRSISGVRAKDRSKFDAMSKRVLPLFEEEVNDGPFKEWKAFAEDIEALRTSGVVSDDGLRSESTAFDVSAFATKAKFLHWLESHGSLVDFAQGDAMQRALNVFVRAK